MKTKKQAIQEMNDNRELIGKEFIHKTGSHSATITLMDVYEDKEKKCYFVNCGSLDNKGKPLSIPLSILRTQYKPVE